jgi:hypothetical protein
MAESEPLLPATAGVITRRGDRDWAVAAADGALAVELSLPAGPLFVLDGSDELFVLPSDSTHRSLRGSGTCWVLPASPSDGNAWLIEADAAILAEAVETGWRLTVDAPAVRLTLHHARPHADVTGSAFALDLPGAGPLADALAAFYWGTMCPR